MCDNDFAHDRLHFECDMWQDKENAILLGVLIADLVNYASNNWMKETSRRETLYTKLLTRSRETLLAQSIFCAVKCWAHCSTIITSLRCLRWRDSAQQRTWYICMILLNDVLDIGKWQRFWWFLHDQMPAQNKCLGYCLVVKCAISVGNLLLNKCLWYWVTAGQVCQLLVCQHVDWCVDWSVSM